MTVALPTPRTAAPTLPVSEVFGPVWQGEGPYAGRLCSFVRLGLCNLSCSWCDTPYTWDRTRYDVDAECPPMTGSQIADKLHRYDTPIVVLSGGEPLMHQSAPALRDLVDLIALEGQLLHVETNGTITPRGWFLTAVDHFTVSPKLDQGDPAKKRLKDKPLTAFAELAEEGRAAWKVVCSTAQDVHDAARLFREYEVPEFACWVMPEGVTPGAVLNHALEIAPAVAERGLNLSLRQHTLMYGQERAR